MKRKLMMCILVLVVSSFAACGNEGSSSDSDVQTNVQSEKEEVIEQKIEKTDESEETEINEQVSEKVEEETDKEVEVLQKESFECLPEMMNASFEDCLMQIDNTIIRVDRTMSLSEVITALQSSGVEYTFKVDDKDYNPDMLVAPWESLVVEVYKNGNVYFWLSALNDSEETVSGTSEDVKVDYVMLMRCAENTYYAKGFRRDGEGHTYGSVKELLKEYTDVMIEKSESVSDIYGNEYQGIEMRIPIKNGEDISIFLTFLFKSEDGTCVGAYSSVVLHY